MRKICLIVLFLSILILLGAYLLSTRILAPKSEVYILNIKRLDKNKTFKQDSSLLPPDEIVDYISEAIGSKQGKETNIKIFYDIIKFNLYWDITPTGIDKFLNQLETIQFYLLPMNNHYPKYRYTNDGWFKITLTPINPSIKPFLENKKNINATPRYCLQSNDCFLFKDVFGSITVSNKYKILGHSNSDYDENTQQHNGQNPDGTFQEVCNLIYSEPKCENNLCTGNKTWGNCWRPSYY